MRKCILLVQFIYLVSLQVEALPQLISADTKCQNNKQQPQQQLVKVNNRKTVTRSGMCPKLTIK